MLEDQRQNPEEFKWKRINMRKVEHLLGVEFIHDLYNRHEPGINSVRFRHTKTTWKNGIVNSYAPAHEWKYLGNLLGSRYYRLDTLTIRNTRRLYKNPRTDYWALRNYLSKTDLSTTANEELLTHLLSIQSIMLGNLYIVNFVQIEHALNWAIHKILQENLKSAENVRDIFPKLIQTDIPTHSQQEKRSLGWIVGKWIILKHLHLYNEESAKKDIQKHTDKYQYMFTAYGEKPKSFEDFWLSFTVFMKEPDRLPSMIPGHRVLSRSATKELAKIKDQKLKLLVKLLVQGGIYRDTTKALLGIGLQHRFNILNEIARREIETEENLKYYLLSDIAPLLLEGKKLDPAVIEKRKNEGVTLYRYEYVESGHETATNMGKSEHTSRTFEGVCASVGEVRGTVKVVFGKEDVPKVKNGDIMVAIGTDFDVLDAMHRSAAVITEEGGILSHASVVCREMHKPCVIGVVGATTQLSDGNEVHVRAGDGKIEIISE